MSGRSATIVVTTSSTSRDLPMPGSPVTATIALRPPTAIAARLLSTSSSVARPTNGTSDCHRLATSAESCPIACHTRSSWSRPRICDVVVGAEAQVRRAQRPRGVADQHRTGWGHLLQPGGGVHDVPHRCVVGAGDRADQHLAGVDADPHTQLVGRVLVAEVAQRRLHRQRRPDRSIGVVLVCDRRTEQRHDGVPEHLVDNAAVGLDIGHQQCEGGVDETLHLLRVTSFGERREPDDVGEQHGHDAALVVDERFGHERRERGAARGAEARAVGHRLRTRGTPHQAGKRTRDVESLPGGIRIDDVERRRVRGGRPEELRRRR